MSANYSFEIASEILFAILLIDFLHKRQFPRNTTRVFLPFVIISVVSAISGILFCYSINHSSEFSLFFKETICIFYYFTKGTTIFVYTLFLSAVSGNVYHKKWIEPVFYWIPSGIFCVLAVISPLRGFFFSFSSSGQYHYGYAEKCFFALQIVILLFHSYHLLRYGDKLKQYERIAVLILTLHNVCCSLIQVIFPLTPLSGYSNAVFCITIYIALRNPNELLDSDTGLFNKTAFYMSISDCTKENRHFSVIFLNICRFRFINMNFGYEQATILLGDISNIIKQNSYTKHIYRIDGDEFALIVDKKQEKELIETIQERFKHPWFIKNTGILLNARISVIRYPEHFNNSTDFLPLSIYVNSLSKKDSESSLFITQDEDVKAFNRQLYIEDAVKDALANHNLHAFFQPIHSAADGSLHSAEVLARIPDVKYGFIPTQEFILIAENNGFIVELGYKIFEEACKYLKRLTDSGTKFNFEYLEVNISAIQCMQPDLAQRMIEIADKYHIRPSLINFEITETAAVQSDVLLRHHMNLLHEKGFTFSLDDYGTGFANSSYLITYPFDQIKFDRSMILAYFKDDKAHLILNNEFRTIKALGKTIVAEGVEFENQIAALSWHGVDYVQGHYFSEPLTDEEFSKYVSHK